MKIVYSLSLLHGIEISLFSTVYLFRNYFPFYAGGFVYVAFRFSLFLVSHNLLYTWQMLLSDATSKRCVLWNTLEYARAGYHYAQFDI